jgi:hypothetical protein
MRAGARVQKREGGLRGAERYLTVQVRHRAHSSKAAAVAPSPPRLSYSYLTRNKTPAGAGADGGRFE